MKETEADFLSWVIDIAHLHGYLVAHFRPALTARGWRTPVQADGKGFPDLVLVNPEKGRLIFAELKSEKGKLSLEQKQWIDALDYTEVEMYVWRPDKRDSIEQVFEIGVR